MNINGAIKAALTLTVYPLGLLATIAVGIPIWQVYSWIRTGEWFSISTIDFMKWADIGGLWTWAPNDFVGLHQILDKMPFCFFLFIAVMAVTFFIGCIIESIPEPSKLSCNQPTTEESNHAD